MRSRSKVLLAVGVACLSSAVMASGALAHGGHREKLGKMSKKGSSALKIEVRGAIKSITAPTATAPGSITFTVAPAAAPTVPPAPAAPAPAPVEWTCAIPAGSDVSAFKALDRVKAKCRSTADTGLTLTRLRHKDRGDKLKVEAKGNVTAYTALAGTTAGTITVDAAVTGQAPVTCQVTDRTRVRGTAPAAGATGAAEVECKLKNGVLTAKKIKFKTAQLPKVEAKGPWTSTAPGSITVATVTCAVPAGTTLPAPTAIVEIKCVGTPLTLTKLEVEDDDD